MTHQPTTAEKIAQSIYDDHFADVLAGGGRAEQALRFALQELIALLGHAEQDYPELAEFAARIDDRAHITIEHHHAAGAATAGEVVEMRAALAEAAASHCGCLGGFIDRWDPGE